MGRSAAFFDLDRTVLMGSSSPEFHSALADAGLVPRRGLPGSGVLGFAYEHFGEFLVMMALARAAALTSRGWPIERVDAAAAAAAARLETKVAPYVRPQLAEHRRDGVLNVLVTTSPEHFVRPLADRLGFDGLLATRYEIRDAKFTGSLDGRFVWSLGKLAAVREWAQANDVTLAESYAYSDSIYDLPLLSAVGHPRPVNPDPRLRIVATARRWPLRWLDVPPGVPKLAGLEPFDLLRLVSRPELMPWVRFDIGGVSRIPRSGPGIVVANHRSYFDTVAIGMTLMQAGRPVRFLGKKEVFDAPVIGSLATALGGIRVDRGSGEGSPLRAAERALDAGELVALMPQGTIPRGPAFFDPRLKGRSGAARLVASSGAPVIPIGLWGTERVWPRSSRLPNLTQVHSPPTVRVRVGRPVAGVGHDLTADTEAIMTAISALLPAESRRRPTPTPDELARTYPPGRVGEERGRGQEERGRRPEQPGPGGGAGRGGARK